MGAPANCPPSRPAAVPPDARWDPQDPGYEWVAGERDANARRHGVYRMWTREGLLHAEGGYEHGEVDGVHTTFHPDGSIASQADWHRGEMQGRVVYRSAHPSPEPFPAGPTVWSIRYDTRGTVCTIRYFLRDGTECSADGTILPEATVAAPPVT